MLQFSRLATSELIVILVEYRWQLNLKAGPRVRLETSSLAIVGSQCLTQLLSSSASYRPERLLAFLMTSQGGHSRDSLGAS